MSKLPKAPPVPSRALPTLASPCPLFPSKPYSKPAYFHWVIKLIRIDRYGILIEQNYKGGDLKGSSTSRALITDLTISGINGSGAIASSGYDIAIVCGRGGCSNWTWSNVKVTDGKTYGRCKNVPGVASC